MLKFICKKIVKYNIDLKFLKKVLKKLSMSS